MTPKMIPLNVAAKMLGIKPRDLEKLQKLGKIATAPTGAAAGLIALDEVKKYAARKAKSEAKKAVRRTLKDDTKKEKKK